MENEHNHPPRSRSNSVGVDKKSAAFGFVGGFLTLCTIGFFILLGVMLSDGDGGSKYKAVAADPSPTPSQIDQGGDEVSLFVELTDGDYFKGNPSAPITLVEYSDLECPFCESFHPTAEQIVADNNGQVKWTYRHFPLRSLHPGAEKKAIASECAGVQVGAAGFWGVIDDVFGGEPAETDDQLATIAAKYGVNKTEFTKCMTNGEGLALVQEDETSALSAGVQGTPHTIIMGPNGEMIPVSGALPASQIQQYIDSLL